MHHDAVQVYLLAIHKRLPEARLASFRVISQNNLKRRPLKSQGMSTEQQAAVGCFCLADRASDDPSCSRTARKQQKRDITRPLIRYLPPLVLARLAEDPSRPQGTYIHLAL